MASMRALAVALVVFAVLAPASANAQSTIAPYFLIVVDSSGSMATSTGSGENSCGHPQNRLSDARCVMQRVINAYGEVNFGLARFQQTWRTGPSSGGTDDCSSPCDSGDGLNDGAICGECRMSSTGFSCTGTGADMQLLVPIGADNQSQLLSWMDYSCSGLCTATGSTAELRAGGGTPLAGALVGARDYLAGTTSPLRGDAAGTCRPVHVILLADGDNSCPGSPSAAATALRSVTVEGRTYDVRTYPIGFGVSPGNASIESIATAGGVDAGSPGGNRGFYASDETTLALAFSQIIEGAIRFETCNGADDDCDTRVDEGYTLYCNRPGTPTQNLCVDPGEQRCDNIDDNCNGQIDEGFPRFCNRPGGVATPTLCADPGETVCNGQDDNCNGIIDEGVCGGCVPSPELCDGLDNDCDGVIDDGLTRACGTDVGQCSVGVQTCTVGGTGVWGACVGGVGPTVEICDSLDNDCDGVVDGITRPCGNDTGACQAGTQLCTMSVWGACSGAIGSSTEVCNGVDDDCDGPIDELNPGGGGSCGSSLGRCTTGTLQCSGGALVCSGGTGPTTETCNGTDDDCDGATDESVPTMGACGSTVGECRAGVQTCVAGAFTCVGARGPVTEICNGRDDDCDGPIDELNPGGGGACGTSTGACEPGVFECTGGTLTCTGGVGSTGETCNSIDDDCDGATDEAVPTMGACGNTTGECEAGVLTCTAGSFTCVGARGPVTELCNALDDDCDSSTDEMNPGGGSSCGTDVGECAPGTSQCIGGTLQCVGDVRGVPEVCNGDDDDCDGLVDEGNPGGGGTCGATAVGECDLGALACQGGVLVCRGETGPTPEICDGRDNDCDSMVDEMNPEGGVPCGNDTGECTAGTTLCSMGALICMGGTGPTDEVCNLLDDDCDGVEDEGIPVGAPCGTDVGECSPGVNIGRTGGLVCLGEIGPVDETCNALDDDCDGTTDEGLPVGVSCGTDEGVCSTGTTQCIGGIEICVGEMPGMPEECDCEDNDCDGMTDEPPPSGSLCPTGTACISCSCSRECIPSEFGPQCPTGTVPESTDGTCYCVRPRCTADECATQTVSVDGEAACAPEGDLLGACVCRNNECTFPCDGVVCTSPLVCRPADGVCVADDCTGLGCPSGQLCDIATGACVADACDGVTCGDGEACREGTCEASCATVSCDEGERCTRGICVADPCAAAGCVAGEVCDPSDGTCVPDACDSITCAAGQVCDPVTGDCVTDPCTVLHCPDGELCVDGECETMEEPTPDGGMADMDGGTAPDAGDGVDAGRDNTRVLAAGGGGCICATPGASGGGGAGSSGGLLLTLLGVAIAARRRARRVAGGAR